MVPWTFMLCAAAELPFGIPCPRNPSGNFALLVNRGMEALLKHMKLAGLVSPAAVGACSSSHVMNCYCAPIVVVRICDDAHR